MKVLTQKKMKITFLVVLLITLFALILGLLNQPLFIEVKMLLMDLLKPFFRSINIAKNIRNKHFNKNLIMREKEKHLFQQSNSCWICNKLIDNDEEKVRDHCHVTGKFSGAAHQNCNINFQLTKSVPVIFYNLRGYDSHLTFNELDKFDVKINVIPNGFRKIYGIFWNKNLVFFNSMQL